MYATMIKTIKIDCLHAFKKLNNMNIALTDRDKTVKEMPSYNLNMTMAWP